MYWNQLSTTNTHAKYCLFSIAFVCVREREPPIRFQKKELMAWWWLHTAELLLEPLFPGSEHPGTIGCNTNIGYGVTEALVCMFTWNMHFYGWNENKNCYLKICNTYTQHFMSQWTHSCTERCTEHWPCNNNGYWTQKMLNCLFYGSTRKYRRFSYRLLQLEWRYLEVKSTKSIAKYANRLTVPQISKFVLF